MLDVNGIRAIVTFRAKRADRLRRKLLKRSDEKEYTSHENIRNDIVDFAGVRAALYFPGDQEKFGKLIDDGFLILASKVFPDGRPLHPKKRFTGYHATHYRVQLRADNLPDAQKRYASTPIEIQVASVLMHAWSEVEHDLVYKPLTGSLSDDELAILDEINGLTLAGEIALERLQRAVETRVARRGSAFTNHYELAAFLYEELRSANSGRYAAEPIMGRVDVLLAFLREAELDTPDSLRPYIAALSGDTESRPISDQIADKILSDRGDLYSSFIDIRKKSSQHNPYGGSEITRNINVGLVGEFLSRWIIFERFMRMLSREYNQISSTIHHASIMNMTNLLETDDVTKTRIRRLRNVRNDLVHGVRITDQTVLQAAIDDFDTVFTALEISPDSRVKAAMRWARSGEDDIKTNNTQNTRL